MTKIAATRRRTARPLPVQLRPVGGETIRSFLHRLATANHVDIAVLAEQLPPWFQHKIDTHDDLARPGRHPQRPPIGDLAALTGLPTQTLAWALPAFGLASNDPRRPVRATTACQRCMAARGIHHPVPVHLPHHQRLCTRHAIWASGRTQLDLLGCPEIVATQYRAMKILRRCPPPQLIFAEVQARQLITDQFHESREPWTPRLRTLMRHNATLDLGEGELLDAAAYPETITRAAELLRRRFVSPSHAARRPHTAQRQLDEDSLANDGLPTGIDDR